MKLKKITLVDINYDGKNYDYVYAVLGKSFFKKVFFKIIFTSKLPHYWWTDIQKMMRSKNIYWEDIVEGEATDLEIGFITYTPFSQDDFDRYGDSFGQWKPLLDAAVKKQRELKEEYEKKYGEPDLKVAHLWNG